MQRTAVPHNLRGPGQEPCRVEPHQWGMQPVKNTHDEIRIVGSGSAPVIDGCDAVDGARSDLQSGLARAVLFERQLPEQGTEYPYTGDYQRRLVCAILMFRRRSVHGGCGVLYRPRRPPLLLLLNNSVRRPTSGGRRTTR